MRKIHRAACPQILTEKGPKWTKRFVDRGRWTVWPQHGKRKLNHILQEEGLRSQTQDHCSYCDLTPISPPGDDTIDHFRPKSGYPDLAFAWDNLFYCCTYCQGKKREQFEEALLKPDQADYEFSRYFQWDFSTGKLLPNEVAETEDQHRAARTIDLLKLNEKHPALRMSIRNRLECRPEFLDDHSYRDFLEWAFE